MKWAIGVIEDCNYVQQSNLQSVETLEDAYMNDPARVTLLSDSAAGKQHHRILPGVQSDWQGKETRESDQTDRDHSVLSLHSYSVVAQLVAGIVQDNIVHQDVKAAVAL